MIAGIIIGAAAVLAALISVRMGASFWRSDRYFIGVSVVALLIVGVVVTVALTSTTDDPVAAESRSNDRIATNEIARVSSSLRQPESTIQESGSVPSVPSLIDGLERRLQTQSADPRGWALLAQSYAFIGESELAEQAVVRAVEYGFDEADLRQRVASASRDPHAGLPGFAAIE